MKIIFLFLLLTVTFAQNSHKTITMVQTKYSPDGETAIDKSLMEDCIVKLPTKTELAATVTSKPLFLKGINGTTKKDWVKVHEATVMIDYLVHQKILYIITQNTINPNEPMMREVPSNRKRSIKFKSDSNNGDIFGGRSNRRYLFSTAELAKEDAKARAESWLSNKRAVLCPE
ncbi:MAG: hypothetical protein ACTSW1_07515 [Candidatus Hodarchaeales archaeon]